MKKLFGLIVCTRTSGTLDEKPCEEAELVKYIRVDRRTTDDPLQIKSLGASWYAIGKNHRIENGMIARDFNSVRWMVRINNGSELQAFIKKYGKIILKLDTDGSKPCYGIEIYDDYRE